MLKLICINLIRFYQVFLSPLKPKCCRYYPNCSTYAILQFQKNTFFIAFFHTFLRIIKCNPFFIGGIDYPLIKKQIYTNTFCFTPYFLSKKTLIFLYIPQIKNKFYLVKVLKKDIL